MKESPFRKIHVPANALSGLPGLFSLLALLAAGCAPFNHSSGNKGATPPPSRIAEASPHPVPNSEPSPLPSPSPLPPAEDPDEKLVQPIVDVIFSLSTHHLDPNGEGSSSAMQDRVRGLLLKILKNGRKMGMRFSGFSIGRFNGGTLGLSGSFGREVVLIRDSRKPGLWKIATYSISNLGVGIGAQVSTGINASVLFDLEDLSEYNSAFCTINGLSGQFVDFGFSFRFGCGFEDFRTIGSWLGIHNEKIPASTETETQAVAVEGQSVAPTDQEALLLKIARQTRVKAIGGSVAVGGGVPLGIILAYQPHKQLSAPDSFEPSDLEKVVDDLLF